MESPLNEVPDGIADDRPAARSAAVGPASSCVSAAAPTAFVAGTVRRTGASLPSRTKYTASAVVAGGADAVVVAAVVGAASEVISVDGSAYRREEPQPAAASSRSTDASAARFIRPAYASAGRTPSSASSCSRSTRSRARSSSQTRFVTTAAATGSTQISTR